MKDLYIYILWSFLLELNYRMTLPLFRNLGQWNLWGIGRGSDWRSRVRTHRGGDGNMAPGTRRSRLWLRLRSFWGIQGDHQGILGGEDPLSFLLSLYRFSTIYFLILPFFSSFFQSINLRFIFFYCTLSYSFPRS